MEMEILLRHLLPEELFEYFDLVSIKETKAKELNLYLDEKKVFPPEHKDKSLISYGFDEPIKVQDFPLRKKSVYLIVRRRKWQEKGDQFNYRVGGIKSFLLSFIHGNGNTTTPLTARRVI